MAPDTLPDTEELRAALPDEKPPIRLQRIGFRSKAGVMEKLTWSEPMTSLAEEWNFDNLLNREDYDLDNNTQPGQRGLYLDQVAKIADGIRRGAPRPFLGTLVVGTDPDPKFLEVETIKEIASGVELVKIIVRHGAPTIWCVDGQHRVKALDDVWKLVKHAEEGDALTVREHLEASATEMTLLLEADPDTLSTLFVKMASTKPIDDSLMAVMDKENATNRLGQYVIRNARLCRGRIAYLPDRRHKERDAAFTRLYKAAAVRSAASAIAGVGVRDRTPKARQAHLQEAIRKRTVDSAITADEALAEIGQEVVQLVDLASERLPGWRELTKGTLTVPEFRKAYLHSAAAGLHVIANTIAAARVADVDILKVLDGLAAIPWRRDAFRFLPADKETNTDERAVHAFFEGTLATTTWVDGTGWRAGAPGATRANYEPAIAKVLKHLATEYPDLAAIGSPEAFAGIGLIARRGVGRPRKTPETTSAS
ncbi:DNA sulfur modification protein DndB [Kitasatospora purpeofusca]|uniref:DNA sulfur modification protein DndB n=1 Tax=Kitasatospora purpeofusca TaxID=67352 RepID=UPI0035D9BB0E